MEYFLGVDVSAEKLDFCIIDRDGEILSRGEIPNTKVGIRRLLSGLPSPDRTCVVFESTGIYGKQLGALIAAQVALPCEVNPKLIKNAATTMTATKTDAVDAVAIARVALALAITNPAVLERARVSTQENYDLELWLAEYERIRRATVRLERQVDTVSRSPAKSAQTLQKQLRREIVRLKKRRAEIIVKIEEYSAGEDTELVESIVGIGRLSAAALVCKIGNIDRFDSADHLKAYFGEYPCIRQSGTRRGQSRVAQHGNALVRHLLWNCAKPAAVHNPACRALYERLRAKGKPAPYAWAAVARKLLQIVYGVLKSRKPWDPTMACGASASLLDS